MNRIDYISLINTNAARFVLEVEGYTAIGTYHINIHAETFIIPVLNKLYNLSLKNLNTSEKKNYPAIDLADFDNKIAFQISSTSTQSKIQETLRTYKRHELYKKFDKIYFYFLTDKKQKYNQKKLNEITEDKFEFDSATQILDKDRILEKINSIEDSQLIGQIAKIYKHDFSDVQIDQRKQKYKHGYLNTDPEPIAANLLEIDIPKVLYQAELNIDEETITNDLNNYLISIGKKPIKKLKPNKLVRKALKRANSNVKDWVLHKNLIISFRNPHDGSDGFSKIIDKGTIEEYEVSDFYSESEASKMFLNRYFKKL